MSIPKKRTPALPALLSILFLVIYLAWLIWAAPRSPQGALTGTWTLVFTGLAALGLAWEVRSGLSARADRRAWSVLCAALLLLTLADGFRAFPSLAWLPDLITLAGYTVLLTSLLLYPRRARSTQGRFRPLAEALISAAAALTLAWMILFQPLFRNAVFNVTTLLPALDMLILLALLVLYLTSQPGGSSGLFGWLAAALTALTISDLSYAILLPQGGYSPVSLVNLGWVLGDLLLIAAISSRWGRPTLLDPPSPAGLVSRATERAQLLMPLVLTAALGWYTVIDMQLRGRADPIGLWASVLLSLALIARQGLLAGEYEFQRYARLADSIAEPTFICDRRGRVQWANPALIKIAGLARAEDLVRLPLEQLFRPSQEMQRILAAGQAGGWSGEMHLQRSDGQRVPVMLSLRPLPWSGRDKLALAGTAHDLSEIKRQQTALQQAYEDITAAHLQLEKLNSQLEQRVLEKTADLSEAYAQLERQNLALRNLDRLKSDFVSLVSHELRAPLTNINGGIELVLARARALPPTARETLDLVQAEIVRLTRFIETILDLSALDAGKAPVYPAPTDLHGVVAALQRQMLHLPGSERIRWDVPAGMPELLADQRALSSVLFHLLDNALKYAPEGEIVVSGGQSGGAGWLQVSDQGKGIPEEDLPLLFTRFFRSQQSDAQVVYGHGLGLYIVQRLLEAMDGTITVENRPEGGANFTCRLPLAAAEEPGEEDELQSTRR